MDTDIGLDVDDALALGLVLACPDALELVAVTTVWSEAPARARLAAELLGLAGRSEVEVCPGEERALLRPPPRIEGIGSEHRMRDAPPARISSEPAPQRIARAAREVEGLEIVLVGPLTNLARALALDPELPRRVAGITVMGGHVREARIGEFVAPWGLDYNLCSDPEASVAVLGAGFRTTLVTADVTMQTWLREADLERLASAGPLARALADQVRAWTPVQRRIFTAMGGSVAPENVAFLHDPLTVLSLVDESPLRFENLRIVTALERGVLRTWEVEGAAGPGAEMRVATGVDAPAARDAIVDRLLGT